LRGKLCATFCGIALTWFCAATGLFLRFDCTLRAPGLAIARARIRDVAQAVREYAVDHGRCPRSSQELLAPGLVSQASLVDPWGKALTFSCTHEDVTVESAGPDHVFRTADDIKNDEL
jgi:hypothetical protein